MTVVIGENSYLYYHVAHSLEEYIELIGKMTTDKRLYFRGLSDVKHDLSPSLGRCTDNLGKTWLTKESRLIQFAAQSFPELFKADYPTTLLSNLQHYGINTRMMDVTGNALVALYFACSSEKNRDKDGKVVIFEGLPVSTYDPYANIMADTYRLTGNIPTDIERYLYAVYNQAYSSTLVYPGWEKELNRKNPMISCVDKPILIDVGYVNLRQRNQDGKFLLFPNRIVDGMVIDELVKITVADDIVRAEIKIPKELKDSILEKFNYLGITDSFIYPDDVSVVMGQVKQLMMNE